MASTKFRVVFKPGTWDNKIPGKSQPGLDLERVLIDFMLVKGIATNPSGDCCTLVAAGGGGGAVTTVFGRAGAVVAVAGDYTAAQVTNVAAGSIAATTVQAAINELATEKTAKFRVVQNLAAGNNTITHNLGLASPFAVMVETRDNVTGDLVLTKVTGEAANSVVINTTVATTNTRITIIG